MRPNNLPKQLLKTLFDSPVAYSHSKSKQKLINALELKQLTKADVSVLNNIVLAVEAAKKSSIPGYTIVAFYTFKPTANSPDTKETIDIVLNSDVWVFMTASGNGNITVDVRTARNKWKEYSECTRNKLEFIDNAIRLYIEAYSPVQPIQTEINKPIERDAWVMIKISGFNEQFIIPKDSDPAVVKQVVYQTLKSSINNTESSVESTKPFNIAVGLALYNVESVDILWPAIKENIQQEEERRNNQIFNILSRRKPIVDPQWIKIYQKNNKETAKKMILEGLMKEIRKQQKHDHQVLLRKIQRFSINDLNILNTYLLLVSPKIQNTQINIKNHLAINSGTFEKYNHSSKYINSSFDYSQQQCNHIGLACAGVCILIGVGVFTVIGLFAALTGGTLVASAPITKYILDASKEGAGGWGDSLRRAGQGLKMFIKKGYYKTIKGKSDEEILKIFQDDITAALQDTTPQMALQRLHAMSSKQLLTLPKKLIIPFIENSLLSLEQYALIADDLKLTDEQIKLTIYNPNYVLYNQNLSQSQILSLDSLVIERFLRAKIFTNSQINWMLEQNIIKKKSLRGTPYDLDDIKDSPDYNQTQNVEFGNFDK